MIIVIDASAAIEVVLNRNQSERLADTLVMADTVIVPSLFIAEVTNVLWKYYQYSDMPIDECEKYLDASLRIPDDVLDTNDMAQETLNAAALTGMTVYDMLYMVSARRHGASLMTLDKKLASAARKQGVRVC